MPVQPSGFIAEEANPQFKEAQVGAFSPVGMKGGGGEEHSVKVTDFLP